MRHINTDILVIGGGATGTGILRDLAMRGFKCLLVERRDLAYGTTGRYHGLLHSGGRYVVKDPLAAKECIQENQILRRIMPDCIEDTGGFFVLTSFDDLSYVPLFLGGCRIAGIPTEHVEISQMLKEEPMLDPKIQQCFRVPDASADSFLASDLNAESARQHGAIVLTYHEVISLSTSSESSSSTLHVNGVICHDLVRDDDLMIDASLVVNASGAWAGKISKMAGLNLSMVPGKGTMLALNHRVVNTIINRCKLPSDGDILVPAHTVAVIGTTDIKVTDPDTYSIEPWEIRLMMDEGEKIIPLFKQFRVLRAWAGIRPLIQLETKDSNRDISRAFSLIDHAERDGTEGFITITGGKWTTYRKMAEATVDKVCEKLKTNRKCCTHLEKLPSKIETKKSQHYQGTRLEKIEAETNYGRLVCECELTTRDEIEQAIMHSNAVTLDDIRRDLRLGMGPCQGAFCTIRTAGILHELRHPPIEEINASLRDFLEERWKGVLPVLWGHQLRQERLNEYIYINCLNANHLPGESRSRFSSEKYDKPTSKISEQASRPLKTNSTPVVNLNSQQIDVVVVGAGLSGLFSAWQACTKGIKTKIITKGWGTPYWSTGCIDILGYLPSDYKTRVSSPMNSFDEFVKTNPKHPYALIGFNDLDMALRSFMNLCQEYGYPYYGSLNSNYMLPTALGSIRPTCLAPGSMIAGDLRIRTPMLIVGFSQYLDFSPGLVADNLNAQGVHAKEFSLDLLSLRNRKFISAMVLARLFDNPDFCTEVVAALKPRLGNVARVGFPAVLGLLNTPDVLRQLEEQLGLPVFEIPGLPPSIPGIRLHNLFASAIQNLHGSINNGMSATYSLTQSKIVVAVISEAAAKLIAHPAKHFILATGGILGGGIIVTNDGYAQDTVFNIPIEIPPSPSDWFYDQFLSTESHPIHTKGLQIDLAFHPIDKEDQLIYQNLYASGSIIGNCDPIRECSVEGIGLASGYKIVESISKGHMT